MQSNTHTHTHKLNYYAVNQGEIISIKLQHQHATGGSNKTCGWHAKQKKSQLSQQGCEAISMQFAWG